MSEIFMNLENSKTTDAHRLRIDLRRSDNRVALPDLTIYYQAPKTIHLKYQEQHGMKCLNVLMDLIPYQTFKTILNTSTRSMKH